MADPLREFSELRIGVATGDLPDLRAEPGTLVQLDVGAAAARVGMIPDEAPVPYDAMEHQLLQQAVKCAAGDKQQQPRRELVAVALREVRREQALRDRAEAAELELQRQVKHLTDAAKTARTTRRGLVVLNAELLAFAAEHFGCTMDSATVLAKIRAARPGLSAAIAAEQGTPALTAVPRGSRV